MILNAYLTRYAISVVVYPDDIRCLIFYWVIDSDTFYTNAYFMQISCKCKNSGIQLGVYVFT